MGYTTKFEGQFDLDRPLDIETYNFLRKFNETRRMARRVDVKYGVEGEFYVDGGGHAGQDNEPSIIDYNTPPRTQPGLWCQWIPTDDGCAIEWDGGEKFYDYDDWIVYLIKSVLAPKGYVLNGEVDWQGEDPNDFGRLVIKDNVLTKLEGKRVYASTGE